MARYTNEPKVIDIDRALDRKFVRWRSLRLRSNLQSTNPNRSNISSCDRRVYVQYGKMVGSCMEAIDRELARKNSCRT